MAWTYRPLDWREDGERFKKNEIDGKNFEFHIAGHGRLSAFLSGESGAWQHHGGDPRWL